MSMDADRCLCASPGDWKTLPKLGPQPLPLPRTVHRDESAAWQQNPGHSQLCGPMVDRSAGISPPLSESVSFP